MQMALLDDVFKGNVMTALAIGLGALLLAPMVGQVLRPAAKAVIKGGMLAYQGLAELGEVAGDLAAEARAELGPEGDIGAAPSPPAAPRSSPASLVVCRARTLRVLRAGWRPFSCRPGGSGFGLGSSLASGGERATD
jgi:uncharacterized protein DUF5132